MSGKAVHDAPSEPGVSGSPIIDLNTMKVVGLHWGATEDHADSGIGVWAPFR
eukprot:TRINITY_DN216_c0_g5_i1.p3 TRINITY_DN216_c0_g5~~TRINITY_DN216_c0_g5_i1.p3  ORF type:complete len:52 (-),score=10.01 TRINITY_DN216_c0_g5_i1:148-303(-)